jgi:F-type H+-transporting ATPase subunit a
VATEAHGEGGFDPLHQFQIEHWVPIKIGDLTVSFTNSAAFMVAAVVLIILFTTLTVRRRELVPGRWQSLAEVSYEFIAGMIRDNVGNEGKPYFPFIFSLFMFILFCNMLGMLPYSFTVTSQIVVTFGLAMVVFIGVTIIGFIKHGFGFFGFFLPNGVPGFLAPLVIPIEVLSYLIRPVSLGLRLFANLTAGHTMLKVFAGFIISLGAFYVVPGAIPFSVVVGLTVLEFAIAFLQAYVFAVLSCIYLHDAIHMH